MSLLKPATIVYGPGEWYTLREAILRTLLLPSKPGDVPLRTRVKVGMVLLDTSTISEMSYGEHEPGVGRHLEKYARRRKVMVELQRDYELTRALTSTPVSEKWSRHGSGDRSGIWSAFNILGRDAFSFSHLEEWRLEELLRLPELAGRIIATGFFDPTDWLQFHLLWRLLLPHAVITDGHVLEAVEDEPTFLNDWTTLTDVGSLTFDDGAFFEQFDTVYVDENSTGHAIPIPLTGPDAPPEDDTPVGIAMTHANDVTGPRISPMDSADELATVARSLAFYEYPDPNMVEFKVRDFLLNRDHHMGRWRDFTAHGLTDHADGAYVVASTLASVFYGPFLPLDVRVTADHALQFSVPILLPSRFGPGMLPLMTAWTFRDGPPLQSADINDTASAPAEVGLWLSTAYVDFRQNEYALPLASPFGPATYDWERVAELVESEAWAACARAASSADETVGWLWIPRGVGRQQDFYKWVRRHRNAQIYQRRAFGGPVALYSLRGHRGVDGETGVSTAMRLAQALLGVAGIRSHVALHFD